MSWSDPQTVVPGGSGTAALWDSDVRDNMQAGPVASSVTALNALVTHKAAGCRGFIKVGSSPYDVVSLVWDATLSKWVEEDADLMVSLISAATTTSTSYTSMAAGPLMPHKIFTDAGLVLNARIQAQATAGASSSIQIACIVSTGNAAGALTLDTTNVTGSITTSSASPVLVDGGWTAISGSITPKDVCSLSIGAKRTGSNNGNANSGTALWMRWTS